MNKLLSMKLKYLYLYLDSFAKRYKTYSYTDIFNMNNPINPVNITYVYIYCKIKKNTVDAFFKPCFDTDVVTSVIKWKFSFLERC